MEFYGRSQVDAKVADQQPTGSGRAKEVKRSILDIDDQSFLLARSGLRSGERFLPVVSFCLRSRLGLVEMETIPITCFFLFRAGKQADGAYGGVRNGMARCCLS